MSILELLIENLPQSYIDCVVNNLEDRNVLYEEGYSFSSEIMILFDWHESREGYEFWQDVFDAVYNDEQLPLIPLDIVYKPSCVLVMKDGMYLMNVGDTGLNLRYEVLMKELPRSAKKAQEQVYSWLN
jgi:hypothetical protein